MEHYIFFNNQHSGTSNNSSYMRAIYFLDEQYQGKTSYLWGTKIFLRGF